jgi:flagellar hook protein FlgE
MMRALLSAVAALRAHQARMDTIGNNIANINTTAFKGARAVFQEMLSQTMRGATAPTATSGGINPMQIGLGADVASIDSTQTQGSLEMTGRPTDLAIQGNGFFMLSDGSSILYTRDGSFDLDADGYVVHRATGLRLLGWSPNADGEIDASSEIGATSYARVPLGSFTLIKATENVSMSGNLRASEDGGATYSTSVNIFDSLGEAHTLTLTFTKSDTDPLVWDWSATAEGVGTEVGSGSVTFDSHGACLTDSGDIAITGADLANGADGITAAIDFSAITQLAGDSTLTASGQDGFSVGTLESFNISQNGLISGVFTNGMSRDLSQIALTVFANPGGLERVGGNLYRQSMNSGHPQVSAASAASAGKISSGFLEAANVDLGAEFTDMIVTQRGFQANSRIVSVVDQMLADLINLKQ